MHTAATCPSGSRYRFSGESDGPVINRPVPIFDHVVEQELGGFLQDRIRAICEESAIAR